MLFYGLKTRSGTGLMNALIRRIADTKKGTLKVPFYFMPAGCYIMPPIPPPIAGAAGVSSGLSARTHSVVRNIPATEAAFSRAILVTLVGSITPEARRFSFLSVRELYPK